MTLRQYMKLRGLSVRRLAEASGVDRNAVQRGGAGRRISAANAQAICAYVERVEKDTGISVDITLLLLGSG